MRRLTSVFAHMLPTVAAIGLLVTAPALAQTTPPPSRAMVMPAPAMVAPATTPPHGFVEPMLQPGTVAPTPARPGQGRQPGQGQQGAQQGQGTTPPASAPSTPRPEPRAPSLSNPNAGVNVLPPHTNIRLELSITDTFTGSPVKKTVTMLVLQGNGGMIRTTSADGWASLNVDTVAAAYTNGMVSIRMTFEYTPAMPKEPTTGGRPPRLNESITVVLQDGKPMMVSQSADPATDRKVTAELTATILK